MKRVSLTIVAIAICISLFSFACSRRSTNMVTLAGSTAFQPFAEKLAEQYIAANPGLHVNVQGGGSAVGIQSALAGNADIGMADLLDLPQEAKALTATIVARDGIAIIVNPKNDTRTLTSAQAHDIFAGKINNWKDVGGPDTTIRVISREDGSGTRRSFDKMVLGSDKLASSALFQNSNGTIREAVASDPSAIGYLSIGLVDKKVKAISYNDVPPTNEMVKKGTYPLSRPIYFLTKSELKPQTKAFIDYVLSAPSQKELEKEGLISAK